MKPKLLTLFILVGIIPLGVSAWISLNKASAALIKAEEIAKESLENQVFDQLVSVREIKKSAIERYFQTINDQMLTFSENRMVVEAMQEFRKSFRDYRNEIGVSDGELLRMKRELSTFYEGEFSREYEN